MTPATPPRPDGPDPSGAGDWTPPPPAGRWPERLPTAPVPTRPAWRWWHAIGVFLVAIAVSVPMTVPVARGIGGGTGEIVASLVGDVTILVVVLAWLQIAHPGWPASVGFPERVGPEIAAGLTWGVAIYLAGALLVGAVVIQFLSDLTGEMVETPTQVPTGLGALGLTAIVLRAVVAAPVAEELFFRAVLFGAFRTRYGFWPSALFASIVFGLVHPYPGRWQGMVALMITLTIVGIGLCALYERRGNIVANVVAHATFNAVGLVLIANLR